MLSSRGKYLYGERDGALLLRSLYKLKHSILIRKRIKRSYAVQQNNWKMYITVILFYITLLLSKVITFPNTVK